MPKNTIPYFTKEPQFNSFGIGSTVITAGNSLAAVADPSVLITSSAEGSRINSIPFSLWLDWTATATTGKYQIDIRLSLWNGANAKVLCRRILTRAFTAGGSAINEDLMQYVSPVKGGFNIPTGWELRAAVDISNYLDVDLATVVSIAALAEDY